jgi:hypothetical protein
MNAELVIERASCSSTYPDVSIQMSSVRCTPSETRFPGSQGLRRPLYHRHVPRPYMAIIQGEERAVPTATHRLGALDMFHDMFVY